MSTAQSLTTSNFSNISNNSGIKLFYALYHGNIISPASIAYALSLIHIGATGNTDKELTNFFGNKALLEDLYNAYNLLNYGPVKTTNALFVRQDKQINPKYKEAIEKIALLTCENFNNPYLVASKINNYIEKNTSGLIKNLVSENDIVSDLAILLINTIYFKAKWENPFDKSDTFQSRFSNLNGITTIVNMMYQNEAFLYYEDQLMQVIEMNYIDKSFSNNYSMGVILPKYKSNKLPIIDINKISEYINNMELYQVDLYLPKFTHRANVDLIPALKKWGVKELFTTDAMLNNISDNIFVSKVIHEAIVIVDEAGTEASATTACYEYDCCDSGNNLKQVTFKADHSFIYYIRHKKLNTILFLGNYNG